MHPTTISAGLGDEAAALDAALGAAAAEEAWAVSSMHNCRDVVGQDHLQLGFIKASRVCSLELGFKQTSLGLPSSVYLSIRAALCKHKAAG